MGRAFAGDAAIAENASVVARNPALMSQIKQKQLSIVGTYVVPDVSLIGQSAPAYSSAAALDDKSIAPEALIPAAYFVMPVNERFTLGFGLFSNFGLATKFSDEYAAGQIAGETEIVTVNFNSSLSYKVTDKLDLGLGINYIHAEAKVKRYFGVNPLGLPTATEAVNLEGSDSAYGWNIGLAYELSEGSRLGLHYRSETELTFTGDYSNQLPASLGGLAGNVLPGSLALELPAMAEFSGTHQIGKEWALHYSVSWTQWSSFQELEGFVEGSDTAVFSKEENFSNSFRYALGADYQLTDRTKLRAGVAYDKTPTDDQHLSISIPDTNRTWISVGATYLLDSASSVDVGLSVIRGKERSFTETDNIGGQWSFQSQGNAIILSAQYNHGF